MKYQVKYNGHLLKFADKLITMTKHFAQEGLNYLRVLAGGGTVPDRTFTEEYYKMAEENGMNDNIRLAVFPQSGYNKRESGIYKFVTRLFNLGAGVKYNATQLVVNGNFANGTTGWGALNSTNSVTNGILTNTGSGAGNEPFAYTGIGAKVIGNKYYLRANVTVKSALCTRISITSFEAAQQVSSPIVNNLYVLSGVITASSAFSILRVYHNYASAADSNNAAIEVDNVMCINLTATFGAGNEPSKEVCDVIFADYFDGTKEVQLNDVTQGTANSQPYLFRKGIKNPNGGSRFMTHPTISFAANEAWSLSMLFNLNSPSILVHNGSNNNSRIFPILTLTNLQSANIGWNNLLGTTTTFGTNGSGISLFGKSSLLTFTCDGNGNVSLYKNGQLVETKSTITSFEFKNILGSAQTLGVTNYNGKYFSHIIRSGALTQSQITAEYNLLRSYFPEISTVHVGAKHIATDNCEMVATPMGNVITQNNLAANTELITNAADREFSSDTGYWFKQPGVTISGGTANYSTATQSELARASVGVVGRTYKVTFTVLNYVSGGVRPRIGAETPLRTANGTYEVYIVAASTQLDFKAGASGFTGSIDNVSVEEVGWAGATDLYTAIYNQTSGTVAQKTLAALKAAAMWRSPNSSLDDQAVFGKIYNGYAAQLLKLDIDTYNAENPTTPWGYHVATLPDFQSIKDTLGGVNTAGKKLKINGVEYWTSDNGDNTSGAEVLGSGYIDESGEYREYKEATGFWTTTENGDMLEVVTMRNELDKLFITE